VEYGILKKTEKNNGTPVKRTSPYPIIPYLPIFPVSDTSVSGGSGSGS
jgi:hypothetical protein